MLQLRNFTSASTFVSQEQESKGYRRHATKDGQIDQAVLLNPLLLVLFSCAVVFIELSEAYLQRLKDYLLLMQISNCSKGTNPVVQQK